MKKLILMALAITACAVPAAYASSPYQWRTCSQPGSEVVVKVYGVVTCRDSGPLFVKTRTLGLDADSMAAGDAKPYDLKTDRYEWACYAEMFHRSSGFDCYTGHPGSALKLSRVRVRIPVGAGGVGRRVGGGCGPPSPTVFAARMAGCVIPPPPCGHCDPQPSTPTDPVPVS